MDGFLPIFFLLVVLKIPVLGGLWLVWWAAKSPDPESSQDESGGGPNRWRPMPRKPRGPHGLPGGAGVARMRRGFPQLARSTERVRARPTELVSDRRERVPADGHGPSPHHHAG